jgi:hypothetical protein
MSHCTTVRIVKYAKTQAKIGTPGPTWTLATARKSTTTGTRGTVGMKATAPTPTTPWTSEIAGRPVTVRTSGTNGMPQISAMSATIAVQADAVLHANNVQHITL